MPGTALAMQARRKDLGHIPPEAPMGGMAKHTFAASALCATPE